MLYFITPLPLLFCLLGYFCYYSVITYCSPKGGSTQEKEG